MKQGVKLLALAALIALNWVLPARASNICYDCQMDWQTGAYCIERTRPITVGFAFDWCEPATYNSCYLGDPCEVIPD
jgi:hypothetical protein